MLLDLSSPLLQTGLHTSLFHMKYLLPILSASFLLTGCFQSEQMTTAERMVNPLFAERYAEAMIGRMTELEIQNDPLLEDEEKRQLALKTKEHWMKLAREARKTQQEGKNGFFVTVKEYTQGEALLLGNTLYFDTTFETDPGPTLHVFLTTRIDPRDVEFPDETSVNVSPLSSPYGAQRYTLTQTDSLDELRTVVLFDTKLGRIYGFAQLSK